MLDGPPGPATSARGLVWPAMTHTFSDLPGRSEATLRSGLRFLLVLGDSAGPDVSFPHSQPCQNSRRRFVLSRVLDLGSSVHLRLNVHLHPLQSLDLDVHAITTISRRCH